MIATDSPIPRACTFTPPVSIHMPRDRAARDRAVAAPARAGEVPSPPGDHGVSPRVCRLDDRSGMSRQLDLLRCATLC